MRLAIVGSAGRKEDASRLTAAVYSAMIEKAKAVINVLKTEHNQTVTCLVSGGAALADHVAVDLFLGGVVKDLCLYLPANFDWRQARYQQASMRPFGDSGKIANFYHRNFSRIIEQDSLRQLGEALKSPWCRYQVGSGFMHRNSLIAANSDALLAMTFGNGPCVKEKSGTADTVRKFQKHHPHAPCFHMDLGQLLCYRKAVQHNMPLMLLLPASNALASRPAALTPGSTRDGWIGRDTVRKHQKYHPDALELNQPDAVPY